MAQKMQELALAEGALPRHLHTALFTSSLDNRLLTHRWVGLRCLHTGGARLLTHRWVGLGWLHTGREG